MFKVLSLFAGIGGFDLGLERTGGFRTVAFCEIEPYARAVLAKHWPEVPCYDDVRTLTAARLAADGIIPDVIVGGFPCQDISYAGRGAGLEGKRSGLWWEYHRLIAEIRPRYAIIENVDAIRRRGLGAVLRSLAEIGYDAEWYRISAADVGAPHRRNRIWIVAYPAQLQRQAVERIEPDGACELLGDAASARYECRAGEKIGCGRSAELMRSSQSVGLADANKPRLSERPRSTERLRTLRKARDSIVSRGDWADGVEQNGRIVKPGIRVLAHGVPKRVDQLRCLGNAIVPQIAEAIGQAIIQSEEER